MVRESDEQGRLHPYWVEQEDEASEPVKPSRSGSGEPFHHEFREIRSPSGHSGARGPAGEKGEPVEHARSQGSARPDTGRRTERDEGSPQQARAPAARMSGSRAARLAKHHLYELTDLEPEAVSGLARRESGWLVSIEVVESPRIPSTADLLGSYHVEIDDAGELTECRRVRRYFRNQAGQE